MTVATFNEKYKIYIESDAQKVSAELNKLKVFLTTDLGAALVEAANKLLGFVGGADAVGAALKSLIPVLATAVAAFGAYALVLGSISMSSKLAALGMGSLGLAVNGVLVALWLRMRPTISPTPASSKASVKLKWRFASPRTSGSAPYARRTSNALKRRPARTRRSPGRRIKPWRDCGRATSIWWMGSRRPIKASRPVPMTPWGR